MLGAIAGVLVIAFPNIISLPLKWRIFIAVVSAIIPGILVASSYALRIAAIFCRRAQQWTSLRITISDIASQLDSAQATIFELLQERRDRNAFQIDFCYSYESRTFIALKKKRGATIVLGAAVTVFDRSMGSVMGNFKITKAEDGLYLCEQDGYMDALWLGNIRQHGSQRSLAPPEAIAVVIQRSTGDENE